MATGVQEVGVLFPGFDSDIRYSGYTWTVVLIFGPYIYSFRILLSSNEDHLEPTMCLTFSGITLELGELCLVCNLDLKGRSKSNGQDGTSVPGLDWSRYGQRKDNTSAINSEKHQFLTFVPLSPLPQHQLHWVAPPGPC